MPSTILIVEDHTTVRRALRDWLELMSPQCRVVEVGSGEDAVAITHSESPCVIVMDVHLPGMSGIETTRQIKATLPSAHIVMLTNDDSDTQRALAAAAGASAYVPKLAAPAVLSSTLDALLASARV